MKQGVKKNIVKMLTLMLDGHNEETFKANLATLADWHEFGEFRQNFFYNILFGMCVADDVITDFSDKKAAQDSFDKAITEAVAELKQEHSVKSQIDNTGE